MLLFCEFRRGWSETCLCNWIDSSGKVNIFKIVTETTTTSNKLKLSKLLLIDSIEVWLLLLFFSFLFCVPIALNTVTFNANLVSLIAQSKFIEYVNLVFSPVRTRYQLAPHGIIISCINARVTRVANICLKIWKKRKWIISQIQANKITFLLYSWMLDANIRFLWSSEGNWNGKWRRK